MRNLGVLGMAVTLGVGLACADVDVPTKGPTGLDGGSGRDARQTSVCEEDGTRVLDPQEADVLIVFDRSETMGMALGGDTRAQALASLLSDLANGYSIHLRFGYQEMPGRQLCDPAFPGCCASLPTVGMAPNNAAAIRAALSGAFPLEGATPTAATLRAARAYFDALEDGVPNRYVLLATDGLPNCTLDGTLQAGSRLDDLPCRQAFDEVVGLVQSGVKVIVLGIGVGAAGDSVESDDCLDALAHAGGAALSPGHPGYFTATDPQMLDRALQQIFGVFAQPSCRLGFEAHIFERKLDVSVYIDGQRIPKTAGTTDGWHEDTSTIPTSILITGAYCDRILHNRASNVVARWACPPCIERGDCSH